MAATSQYGLLGGRLQLELPRALAAVSGRYGAALTGSEGRWVQGDLTLSTGARLGPLGLRGSLTAFGLAYTDPFSYDAGGVELRPAVSLPVGPVVVSALPRLSMGAWASEGFDGELRVTGADLEIRRGFGSLNVALSAGGVAVDNGVVAGAFWRAGSDVGLERGAWQARAVVEAQKTPLETRVGGGLSVVFSASPALDLTAYAGRRLRDPLFGTDGTVGFSLGASVRAARWAPTPPPAVAAVGARRDGGRVVAFALRAPEAGEVTVTGDFTGWEPVPMEPGPRGWWRLERVLPAGLHHFAFLVDGHWALPDDAPGVVEDGWGQRNASIVVDP